MIRVGRWVSLVLFFGVGFLYLVSGVVAPAWIVPILWLVWLGHLAVIVKLWSRRPWVVLSAPLLSYLFWAAVIGAGDAFFGWSA